MSLLIKLKKHKSNLWNQKYNKALHFASLFDSSFAKDIAHDAWVYYYEKTGLDLFEVPLRDFDTYLYTVIKRAFYRWYYKERKGPSYRYFSIDQLKSSFDAPDQAIIARDLYEVLYAKIKQNVVTDNQERLESIFRLKADGYTQKEISETLNLNKQVVNYYNKKMSLVNPFNGNKLKITRTITKATWDNKTDKDDYVLDDYNEFYELYAHKDGGNGLLVRLASEVKSSRGEYYTK